MSKNIALLLAGGNGSRIKTSNVPKQFIEVLGKPILAYTLEAFNIDEIDLIVLVCGSEYIQRTKDILQKYNHKSILVVNGGVSRQESSYNGLKAIKTHATKDSVVLIHDAARPLVSKQIVLENIEKARKFGGVCTAIPCTDTVLRVDDKSNISETIKREGLFLAQTPQSFLYDNIYLAHEKAVENGNNIFTDDTGVYGHYIDGNIKIVEGNKDNFKITVDEDLEVFRGKISFKQ